jgi:8-oxo-dGTP pyrophosphatase MutT (NUDIX family)
VKQLSLSAVAAFLRQRLADPLPGWRAQERLAAQPAVDRPAIRPTPPSARPAAALLLLYPGPLGVTIPLTVRHAALPHHAGQISLPGGATEPGESASVTALREAEEEIGLDGSAIEILGPLSPLWIPQSNFVLTAVVGVSTSPPVFAPHPREVTAMVELPLPWLTDPARLKWAQRRRNGATIDYPYFDVDGRHVWGATAMILSELAEVLEDEGDEKEP